MNSEFNNQNINQFESTNMNNQYLNNYNNVGNQNNNNKKWKDIVIVILVIIVFILTAISLYLVIDKKDNNLENNDNNNQQQENINNNLENNDNNNQQQENINNNLENNDNNNQQQENINNNNENKQDNKIDFNNIECEESENSCTKIFNMNYNGMEHEIKIVQNLEGEGNGVPYSYQKKITIYIDDKLLETFENISSATNTVDFNGYAYIFDSKYLGIIYPSSAGDYILNVYNDNIKIGEQKIIWGLQSFYKDSEYKEKLNTLDKMEFNGNKLLFWGDPCYVPINAGDRFVRVSLKIKNNKISMEAVEYLDKTYGGGATC